MKFSGLLLFLLVLLVVFSCSEKGDDKLFRQIQSSESNIDFSNDLEFDPEFNIFRYRNYYNGGGVGLIDFNKDGLQDIYLVANMAPNKLYLNRGEFEFEDVTVEANVAGSHAWSTGVSVADVNADGWPDIYVCNSGDVKGDNKKNELFINNGDGTFDESAEEFGLADSGYSIHSSFFDFDKDGDLDMYLVNNSYKAIGSFNLTTNQRHVRDSLGGDRLFRNDGGKFFDVSDEAGIYGSEIAFGLGVTVSDIDGDGWLDMYISNDFFERDYLYINNQNGGFDEILEEQIKSVSAASMGADIADLNNDGYPEIFVTDMLPPTNSRIKTVTTFDNWDRYVNNFNNGYYHQFTRNTLQFNNGDNTFSEIGRYSGVEATDWSWAALLFDFQNDGLKDIFVSNGISQDLTNQDFLEVVVQDKVTMRVTAGGRVDYETLIGYIPSVPIPNHAFVNKGDMIFSNAADSLGLGIKGFSNGAAYGDLDNDGDLDLITNNSNMPVFLYENQTERFSPENNYLRFVLEGEHGNTNALGSRISVFAGDETYVLEHLPTRGFQSTIDNRPLIGIGKNEKADSIRILWPSGKITKMKDIAANREMNLKESDAVNPSEMASNSVKALFTQMDTTYLPSKHIENPFSDFNRDKLIFQMSSTQGPCLCQGDINNDGFEDLFVGGAAGQRGEVFKQTSESKFEKAEVKVFDRTKISEDVDCALFDANGDGNLDLYVASGGSEFNPSVPEMNDRLYFGDGDFGFELVRQTLPANKFESSSVVESIDFDNDGDVDLFVGIRMKPFFYGEPNNGYILENDGSGVFTNVSKSIAPELEKVGMITDAKWTDLDNDNDFDLVLVGDWMPIAFFINENGNFKYAENLIPNSNGWWNTVEVADLNNDGFVDIIAGNQGLNSRFEASVEKPLHMYVKDFDRNGTTEQIICQYEGAKLYPLPLKHDMANQMPHINKKYPKYENYMDQQISDIFTSEELESAVLLKAYNFSTSVYLSNGDLSFSKVDLPFQVQFSTTHAISVNDYNDDQIPDILFGGNLNESKPEVGRYDASFGSLLIGDGQGGFSLMPVIESGLKIDGQVREIRRVSTPMGDRIVVTNNNDYAQFFRRSSE